MHTIIGTNKIIKVEMLDLTGKITHTNTYDPIYETEYNICNFREKIDKGYRSTDRAQQEQPDKKTDIKK